MLPLVLDLKAEFKTFRLKLNLAIRKFYILRFYFKIKQVFKKSQKCINNCF